MLELVQLVQLVRLGAVLGCECQTTTQDLSPLAPLLEAVAATALP